MRDVDAIRSLPHWARVAFAARCGRVCLPLLRSSWPDTPPERGTAVLAAVELAEHAATTRAVPAEAMSAALDACITAGAALMVKSASSAAASLACKPAEFAARAVAAGPSGSSAAAAEAYGFAVQAAWEAGAGGVAQRLAADLARLRRVAAGGGWTDDTSVPPEVYELLS